MFRRLGVFVGGYDLDAAHAVASGEGVDPRLVTDIVGRLVDKSLVVRRTLPTGERWQLLETMREYALEQLDASGEASEAHAGTSPGRPVWPKRSRTSCGRATRGGDPASRQ